MIDFRYHLISIVAVFLALGIGILMGSVVLDQTLVNQLEDQLGDISATNDELRETNQELRAQVELDENFALSARDLLLREALAAQEVVVFTFADTDGGLLDAVRAGIDQSGGEIAATITMTEKLALPGAPERDELALILGALGDVPDALLTQAGRMLGERASSAATTTDGAADGDAGEEAPPAPATSEEGPGSSRTRIDDLVERLSEAGFLDVDRSGDEGLVPPGAVFLIVGGSTSEPSFPVAPMTVSLATSLAGPGIGVVAAESSTSAWNLAAILRTDDRAQQEVTTVDQAESTSGTIAVVLGLAQARNGCVNHYGVQGGVAGIIPRPSDDC